MISKYFSRYEIACKCGCGLDSMDIETLKVADEVRSFVGKSITPSSGARCFKHNLDVGSNNASQHVRCRAMDLPVEFPTAVYDWLCAKYPDKYGFGAYPNKGFVHIDTRSGPKVRWSKK